MSGKREAWDTSREAVTDWKVLKRGLDEESGERVTYVELSPKTGRTHQLRVHMKYNNTPIVADPLYAPNRPLVLGFERLALHAHSLSVVLPGGTSQTFVAPLPAEFLTAEANLKPLQT